MKEEADSEERWARIQQGAVPEDNPALSHSPESQVGHKTLSERTYCHTGWMIYILTMTLGTEYQHIIRMI